MSRYVPVLLGLPFLGSLLMLGCRSTQSQPGPATPPMLGAWAGPRRPAPNQYASGPTLIELPANSGPVVGTSQDRRLYSPPASLPPTTLVEQKNSGDREMPAAPVQAKTDTNLEGLKQAALQKPASAPKFAHAPDYSWLEGQVELIHSSNAWELRYASIQDDDRYGGGVTLMGAGPLDQLHNGQWVHVEGQLAAPDSRQVCPPYRVQSWKALN